MSEKVGKYVEKNLALAQAHMSEPVLAAAVVHQQGFGRRSVVYLIVVGCALGLGAVLGGLVGVVLALALIAALSAVVGAIRTRVRPTEPGAEFPAHALLAITDTTVYAFEATQRRAWLRGGWSGWGPSGWELGNEVGRWDRSALLTTATKDLISWKLSLRPPNEGPYSLEAQAYGARGSNEAAIGLLTAGSPGGSVPRRRATEIR